MVNTIPADNLVEVTPSVLEAGGAALDCIGLLLTTSTQIPLGEIMSFANASDVGTYFGASSAEKTAADIYFAGFVGANKLPGALLLTQYNAAAVSGYLRGGSISELTLAQVKALTGTITITFAGAANTSSSINLSAATSFSDAATIIQAAFTTPSFSVSWDSVAQAFKFTSTATGATQTIIYATGTGTLYTGIKLTQVTGAVLSQGAAATTPSAFMTAVVNQNRNWATFSTIFDPDVSGFTNKLAFATWNGQQNNRYAYIPWDVATTPGTTVPDTSSFAYAMTQAGIRGTAPVYSPDNTKAVFMMAIAASLDFEQLEGRATWAYRSQSGLVADVHDESTAENYKANGYNYYGDWANAKTEYVFLQPGSIFGEFAWMDSYINQIVLNAELQAAGLTLFTNVKSIPYNQAGRDIIAASLRDPINRARNFGTIRKGVTLSEFQKQAANGLVGRDVSNVLFTEGWYLRVADASPSVRADRGPPPVTLLYMDGQSVQKLVIGSVNVQ